jgi:uncharacterized protein YndB with AHSA1/START domain
MTNQSSVPTLSVSLSRVLAAPPDQVFRAFTDPDWYGQWWGPEGTRSEVKQLDLRVGGAYKVNMVMPDGSVHVMYGSYREIDPPQLLAYSLAWEGDPAETLVTLEFEPHDDGTELTLTHEGFADQVRADQHEHGWTSSFERLVSLLVEHN